MAPNQENAINFNHKACLELFIPPTKYVPLSTNFQVFQIWVNFYFENEPCLAWGLPFFCCVKINVCIANHDKKT